MKHKLKFFEKNGKGQVLVILALIITTLVAMMGMAIDAGYLYVSYARLHRAVDAAALNATAQFTKHATDTDLFNAAQQFLALNNEPITTLTVETCYYKFVSDGTLAGTTKTPYPAYTDPTNPGGNPDEQGNESGKLCTTPPRKLVRVTATEAVPTFFLSVVGIRALPISASATSEAASVEMVLVIDQSESMAWYPDTINRVKTDYNDPVGSNSVDPSYCNAKGTCQPFNNVKAAAVAFIDQIMYAPYDRAAVVSFAKHAFIYDPADPSHVPFDNPYTDISITRPAMVNNADEIKATINSLKVTEGGGGWDSSPVCNHVYDNGPSSYGGPDFPNGFDGFNEGWLNPANRSPALTWTMPNWDNVPCREYWVHADNPPWQDDWPGDPLNVPADVGENMQDPGTNLNPGDNFTPIFSALWCPQLLFATPDGSRCQTSNIGEGLWRASEVYDDTKDLRQQALWVTVLLTDGNANAAYYAPVGSPIGSNAAEHPDNPYCPDGERAGGGSPYCRDTNVLERHCLGPVTPVYQCMKQNYGTVGADLLPNDGGNGGLTAFYWPTAPLNWYAAYPATNTIHLNTDDPAAINKYDADDYARDMADNLAYNKGVTVFAIGLGKNITSELGLNIDPGTPPAGASLLQYIATVGGTDNYYIASNTDITQVFLKIASKIATRLTQ